MSLASSVLMPKEAAKLEAPCPYKECAFAAGRYVLRAQLSVGELLASRFFSMSFIVGWPLKAGAEGEPILRGRSPNRSVSPASSSS